MRFYQADPTLENYWRGVILFGRNVASYKFALAHALYDLQQHQDDLIPLETLAAPFARHLCTHLHHAPKQITSRGSQFLASCVQFNNDEIDEAQLIEQTVRHGFANVIDAFHNVNRAEIDKRFFIDERKSSKGIRLTDNFYQLTQTTQFHNLVQETDARWRLVEQAWALGVSSHLPLHEALTEQTGKTRQQRHNFLQTQWQNALNAGLHTWQPAAQGDAIF